MKRKTSLATVFIIAVCVIIGMVIFTVCMETDNVAALITIVPVIVLVVICYMLFNKLNKIIILLQEIAKQNRGSDETSDNKNERCD